MVYFWDHLLGRRDDGVRPVEMPAWSSYGFWAQMSGTSSVRMAEIQVYRMAGDHY